MQHVQKNSKTIIIKKHFTLNLFCEAKQKIFEDYWNTFVPCCFNSNVKSLLVEYDVIVLVMTARHNQVPDRS